MILELSKDEADALVGMIDRAVHYSGLSVANDALALAQKIKAAEIAEKAKPKLATVPQEPAA